MLITQIKLYFYQISPLNSPFWHVEVALPVSAYKSIDNIQYLIFVVCDFSIISV